jgi:hypothetical protein
MVAKKQHITDPTTPNQQFDAFIIFLNPVSTNTKRAQKRIQELKTSFPAMPLQVVETSPNGREANGELFRRTLKKATGHVLIGVAAGDGTSNAVIEVLMTDPEISDTVRKSPVLPLWGGNANDLAYMLNGPAYKVRTRDILQQGEIVPIFPLFCEMTDKDGKMTTRLAACYTSFGATAYAARRLNDSTYRRNKLNAFPGSRVLLEIIAVVGALIDAPTFTLEEDGGFRLVYDRLFVNGSRLAKFYRTPARLTENSFYKAAVDGKRLSIVIARARDMMPWLRQTHPSTVSAQTVFTTQEPVWAQFDGEVMQVPANTLVAIRPSEKPFFALSTLLNAQKPKNLKVVIGKGR